MKLHLAAFGHQHSRRSPGLVNLASNVLYFGVRVIGK
jgi:hypothetical protein